MDSSGAFYFWCMFLESFNYKHMIPYEYCCWLYLQNLIKKWNPKPIIKSEIK
jgi:hypothetical protein